MNNLIVAVVIAGVSAAAGWTTRDWKADAAASRVAEIHAKDIATANAATLTAQQTLDRERQDNETQLRAIDTDNTEQLRIANNETNRLRLCIANGTCGLRVNVVRTEPASNVSVNADAGGVGASTGVRLTPDAESAYFSLREGIERTQRKLAACQQSFGVLDAKRSE